MNISILEFYGYIENIDRYFDKIAIGRKLFKIHKNV